ncbi:MAG: transposase [Elusimicrobiales bacterium]
MNEVHNKKPRRVFTPEQKYEILKDIEGCRTIREGLQKHNIAASVYNRWKRQLKVGINASLRNSKPIKSPDIRRLEEENKKLKEVILNQSLMITSLKRQMNLD